MSISVTSRATMTVVETVESGTPFATDAKSKITHDQLNQSRTLGASTTPPATKVASAEITISGGGGTIDLTSLPGSNGATVDGTGLKVQEVIFKAPSTNTDPVVIVPGASNPYALKGATWAGLELEPGEWDHAGKADSCPDVAGGAKTIDYSGTNGDKLQYMLVLG